MSKQFIYFLLYATVLYSFTVSFTLMDKNQFQVLNLSTNILTVVLFIVFSIIKRIEANSLITYVLVLLFAINALLSIFLFYQNRVLKPVNYTKNILWFWLRITANIGFAVLSYILLI